MKVVCRERSHGRWSRFELELELCCGLSRQHIATILFASLSSGPFLRIWDGGGSSGGGDVVVGGVAGGGSWW
ncbi:hypothetical protein HanOQP8_Chr12g0440891 [Helianthus annuus]|nr:hypothetical protein HanOQP8_Chr12g0440891 [Helianthus annuus]